MESLHELEQSLPEVEENSTASTPLPLPARPTLSPFERLPPELLDQIWGMVTSTPLAPICKTLLPYQRDIIFRDLFLVDHNSLKRLTSVISNTPGLGSSCWTLRIKMELGKREQYSPRQLEQFLEALPRLHELWMLAYSQCTNLIMERKIASSALDQLKDLRISDPFNGQRDMMWRVECYQTLARYPSLSCFYAVFSNPADVPPSPIGLSATVLPLLANITHFGLQNHIDVRFAPRFLRSMPHLQQLVLASDDTSSVPYPAVIRAAPVTLKYLRIWNTKLHRGVPAYDHLVDDSIKHLVNLEILGLDTCVFSPAIFSHLATLPALAEVRFGGQAVDAFTQDHILNFLNPGTPIHNPTVRTILLNVVKGRIGKSTAVDGLDSEGYPLLGDWMKPTWKDGIFDYAGMTLISESAKMIGVSIIGEAVEAMLVQEAIWREEEDAFGGN